MGLSVKLAVAMAVVAVLGAGLPADAQQGCRSRVAGNGVGKGVLGKATANARAAATADWEAKAARRFGRAFADLNRAREVRWDCKAVPVVQDTCVVTAIACR
jgi:hypothetical protein